MVPQEPPLVPPPERGAPRRRRVRPAEVEALKQLALLGGGNGTIEINSTEFAGLIDSSQQTASRRILELLEDGLIERDLGVKRQLLRLTEDGLEVLRQEHATYKRIFELEDRVEMQGQVVSGVGEGKYYLSQPGYTNQFQAKLGFAPFPGTLNVELTGAEANKIRLLRARPSHVIEGFQTGERTFGGVLAWEATLRVRHGDGNDGDAPLHEVRCAAILPNRSHYTRVIEIIAPVHLRSKMGLEDHQVVHLDVDVSA